MSFSINTNVDAFSARRSLTSTSTALERSMRRLSSGQRINSAADDAAGLGVSERMRSQISGIAQARRNAQDGISLVQTAESALGEYHAILHRIRDLAVQFNNGTWSPQDRLSITSEVHVLVDQLGTMFDAARFNGIPVLSGTSGAPLLTLQVGANDGDVVTVPSPALQALIGPIGIPIFMFMNATAATTYINLGPGGFDDAFNILSQLRAELGATQNRLEHTLSFLAAQEEHLMAAESRIRDTDFAAEMTAMTGLQIRQQAGVAMLAQANQTPQAVLPLLQ